MVCGEHAPSLFCFVLVRGIEEIMIADECCRALGNPAAATSIKECRSFILVIQHEIDEQQYCRKSSSLMQFALKDT